MTTTTTTTKTPRSRIPRRETRPNSSLSNHSTPTRAGRHVVSYLSTSSQRSQSASRYGGASSIPIPSRDTSSRASTRQAKSFRDSAISIASFTQRPSSPSTSTTNLSSSSESVRTPSTLPSPLDPPSPTAAAAASSQQPPQNSPYIAAHVSDPCTAGSLIHHLHPCNHQIITPTVEPCARNCRPHPSHPRPPIVDAFANHTRTPAPFACQTCIDDHVREHRDRAREAVATRFDRTMRRMGGLPADWLGAQLEYCERVIRNDVEKERAAFAMLGRPCGSVLGAPEEDGAGGGEGEGVVVSTAAPWPPRERPKRIRG